MENQTTPLKVPLFKGDLGGSGLSQLADDRRH
jgi:hypothetical protein